MMTSGPKRYDAFLSYNSQDRPAVEELADRLRAEGLALYLEVWELLAGREFQPGLAEALIDSKTCVAFLGPNGLGPWQKEELQVAIDKRVRDPEFHVIPVLLPGAERPRRGAVAHLEFLINASWVEFLRTTDDRRTFDSLVAGIKGVKPQPRSSEDTKRWEGRRPYRGLEASGPRDATFFFGRDILTDWLVSDLRREVHNPQGVRFLAVLGPSGIGKSSLVLAGLVPKLKEGAIDGSQRWPIVVVRPGDDPLVALTEQVVPKARAIRPDPGLSELDEQTNLLKHLRGESEDGAGTLGRYVGMRLAEQAQDVRLVIVVDQFEEVFTYRPENDESRRRFEHTRAAFFANLLHAAAAPGGRVAVVLTMRSDFLGNCASFPRLNDLVIAHLVQVGPMKEHELREAIEQPAFLVGCELEPGLTERLLADVKGQVGALPLLQFTLDELWQKRDVRRLTTRAYTDLGGIQGALEHRADAIFRSFKPEEQELCKRIFLRLVQPGEGTEDTKRRVPFQELLPSDRERASGVRRVIQKLADRDARLITTEGDVSPATGGAVEVAHEALIRGWKQLRQWINDDRAGLRIRRRLTEAAQEWAAADPSMKDDYLYNGARLAAANEWASANRDDLSEIEAAFLSVSLEAERQEKADEADRERRLREAAEAREQAERRERIQADLRAHEQAEAARRLQRRLWVLIGATIATIVAAVIASYSWYEATVKAVVAQKAEEKEKKERIFAQEATKNAEQQTKQARAQTRLSESRRLAALSGAERDKRLDRALLLAVEAHDSVNTREARSSLFGALVARPGITQYLHSDEGGVTSVAFSPDGETLAAGYGSVVNNHGGVVLWDTTSHARLQDMPLAVTEGSVTSVAFRPVGNALAAGYETAGSGSGVMLWDTTSHARLQDMPLAVTEGRITSVTFSPDGETLAAGYATVSSNHGGVVLWDMTSHARLQDQPLAVTEGSVKSVAFSPDGKAVAAGYATVSSNHGGVVLWDTTSHARLQDMPLAVTEGSVTSVAFSPDGRALAAGYATADGGGAVVVWDTTRRARPQDQPLAVTEGSVTSVAFRPDGRALAAGYGTVDGTGRVVVWDTTRRVRLQNQPLVVTEGYVWSVAFSPDCKALAATEGFLTFVELSPEGKALSARSLEPQNS